MSGAGGPAGFAIDTPADLHSYFTRRFDNLRVHLITENHSAFPAFLADRNVKMRLRLDPVKPGFNTVIEITGSRKGTSDVFPLVAASIRSGIKRDTVIHELYSVSTSIDYRRLLDQDILDEENSASGMPVLDPTRRSIAKELLKYVLAFHTYFKLNEEGVISHTPETKPFLYWIGVQTQGVPQEISRLINLYQGAGFFFPNLICLLGEARLHRSYVNNRTITPLGTSFPIRFIAGYWSTSIKEYTDEYEQALFNVDNASTSVNGREKDYALLQTQRVEHTGFLNINDDNIAEREPVNELFITGISPGYEIVGHGGVQGSYTFKDQVRHHNSAPGGTNFVDTTKNTFKRFHFHTHPLACHAETNIARGFPSQQDIQLLFRRNCDMKVGGLMVFSREGSWLIRMNPYLMFLKDKYPDKYEEYRGKTEAYLEILTTNRKEFDFYVSTRNYSQSEIASGINHIMNILAMNTPSDVDLAKAEDFLALTNSRYLLPFRVDGMEMAPFSVQFIRRNEVGYRFAYIIKKK